MALSILTFGWLDWIFEFWVGILLDLFNEMREWIYIPIYSYLPVLQVNKNVIRRYVSEIVYLSSLPILAPCSFVEIIASCLSPYPLIPSNFHSYSHKPNSILNHGSRFLIYSVI
jgi:hypothetical protein